MGLFRFLGKSRGYLTTEVGKITGNVLQLVAKRMIDGFCSRSSPRSFCTRDQCRAFAFFNRSRASEITMAVESDLDLRLLRRVADRK
jgi:hypothetical protein